MTVHILRLAFGIRDLEHLRAVLARRVESGPDGRDTVVITTRFKPRRAREVEDGGSLYWIIKGLIRARSPILAVEDHEPAAAATGLAARRRCAFRLDREIIATVPRPRGVQQGWRYLAPGEAPPDLVDIDDDGKGDLTPELAAELRALGLL